MSPSRGTLNATLLPNRKFEMKQTVFRSLVVLAGGTTSISVWGQQNAPYYGPHMWGSNWHGWIFGPLMMILMLALVVGAVVLLVRWIGAGGHLGSRTLTADKTPLDILKERFAKGEIDREEFEERRRILEE